ncbi:hypothetical protein G9A89_004111 [Geosiphon pyriformis]|nr:hypothetical protein G9A89_004111 [Geosiphon pyriformis]
MKNTVVKKTSYADSNASKINDAIGNTTPRKTCIRTYVLGSKLKTSSFNNLSDDNNNILTLSVPKFSGAKHLLNIELCVLDRCNFQPVKSFALNIELSAVPKKTNSNKLIAIKKFFYQIDGFGGASTPLKFPEIIKSSFTSEMSLKKAKELMVSKKILVNDNVKQVNKHLDWKIIVKEIPIDLLKLAMESVFSKFEKIVSIKIQLIGLWQKTLVEFELSKIADLVAAEWSVLIRKDSVHMTKAVDDKQTWTLLYTLLVGTTAHNLSGLLAFYGRKTCFVGCNLAMYVRDRCAVICFSNETSKLAAIGLLPVFKSVNLHWISLFLACCAKCKQSDHVSEFCLLDRFSGIYRKWIVTSQDQIYLANIYKKKQTPIAHPVSFGGLSWIKIVGRSSFSSLSSQNVLANVGSSSGMKPFLPVVNKINNRFAALECSLISLVEQVSKLAKKLDALGLMISQSSPGYLSVSTNGKTVVGMVSLNVSLVSKLEDNMRCLIGTVLGLSAKVNSLNASLDVNNLISIVTKTKLKGKIHLWIMNKFSGVWVFTSGLNSGYMGSGVAIIMNVSLAKHISKVFEMSGWLLSIKLLFKNKLSADKINFLIAKAVNKFFFIILGRNFNENGLRKCASFKKCLNLGLVNSLLSSLVMRDPTWENSMGVKKTIDYVFVSPNLVNMIVHYNVSKVGEHFDTDHWAVSVSIGLDGFLDTQLNSIYNEFAAAVKFSDLDTIWNVVCKVMCLLVNEVFKKKWFKKYNGVFTKESSKFHKLEVLVLRIAKVLHALLDSNYLVVKNELILEPNLVKAKVDVIMEDWTRKHEVVEDFSDDWSYQY